MSVRELQLVEGRTNKFYRTWVTSLGQYGFVQWGRRGTAGQVGKLKGEVADFAAEDKCQEKLNKGYSYRFNHSFSAPSLGPYLRAGRAPAAVLEAEWAPQITAMTGRLVRSLSAPPKGRYDFWVLDDFDTEVPTETLEQALVAAAASGDVVLTRGGPAGAALLGVKSGSKELSSLQHLRRTRTFAGATGLRAKAVNVQELADVAVSLWTPGQSGPLAQLDAAFETAARVVL